MSKEFGVSDNCYREKYPHVFTNLTENLKLLDGIVSFDIDAVTQATYVLALNKVSHDLGKVVHKEDLTTYWELANIVAKEKELDQAPAMEYAKGVWNSAEVYSNAPEMHGVTHLFKMLNEAEIPHVFISSRPIEFYDDTRKWFAQKFPWIDPENIILGRKEGMAGGDFKSGMVNKLGVALHIEDAVEEAKIIVQETSAHVLIIPQPWNDDGRFIHPRIKYLGKSSYSNGSWPVIRFLSSSQAKDFLSDKANSFCVAQSY